MSVLIRAESLSKKYLIGHQNQESYLTLRDALAMGVTNLGHKIGRLLHGPSPQPANASTIEEFWALQDVSFDIRQGERVGIIGRNGAGKSTLLKILSRITDPTCGRVRIRGRVASLLEVGTGFHPELTGRENIFLNGAILGMSRHEIKRKFDEIVSFAEVERFLDTPVKRYSSGMSVRLAFAVAAHLEPEILIIDEVLAVGDAQFQKKCLGKMEEVGKEGRTVLFVSHNLGTVRQLCSRAILFSSGKLVMDSTPERTIEYYMEEGAPPGAAYRHVRGDGRAHVTKVSINGVANGEAITSIFENVEMKIHYVIHQPIEEIEFFVLVYGMDGEAQLSFFQKDIGELTKPVDTQGVVTLKFTNCLMPGRYVVSAGIFDGSRNFTDWVEHVEAFHVEPTFKDGGKFDNRLGKFSQIGRWSHTDAKDGK